MRDTLKNTRLGHAIGQFRRQSLSVANGTALRLFLAAEERRRRRSAAAPSLHAATGGVALVAHVFYADLLDEIIACHANLPARSPCFVTAPPEVVDQLQPRIRAMPNVMMTPVENRGRDIAPFLKILKAGVLDDNAAVLKLHSKRSPHLVHGALLRRALFTALAGHPDVVGQVLSVMDDPRVGMVGWRRVFMTSARHWHTNRKRVESLAQSLSPPAPPQLAFFGGSMFWFRPAALRSITALPLDAEDFEPETGQIDGMLHHALERCFAIGAAASGYDVKDTAGRLLLQACSLPEPVT